jgi:dihydrodipicolinate synthase/N-acetylneuraminate lyase
MQRTDWTGVMPAITTPFHTDANGADAIDHRAATHLVGRMLDAGSTAIVTPGSLGEGSSLSFDEKIAFWKTCVAACGGRRPVVAAIASASTLEAIALAKAAHAAGCGGLMVLPPYVYRGDWNETREHVSAVIAATPLSCMLYNNPPAYGVDFTAANIAELALRHANLHAVKDSSGDARRFMSMRAACGDRLALFVGLDDCIVEGIRMGATGWIAGLVNALPEESVELFRLAMAERSAAQPREGIAGAMTKTDALYQWFLPLLRLDTGPKFVQLIKLVQAETGTGTERVRAPRLELQGDERAAAIALIRATLAKRPT